MPKAATAPKLDEVRHEYFCLPREGEDAARLEGFLAYTDEASGLSRASSFVTRCLECGAATYRPLSD